MPALAQTQAPPTHQVRFYESEDALAEEVRAFLAPAFASRSGIVLVVGPRHRAPIGELVRTTMPLGTPFQFLGAEVLDDILVEGWPDAERFDQVLGSVIRKAAAEGDGHVYAFGEMVSVLEDRGCPQAAVRLEELWNDLATRHRMSILCAYSLDIFAREPLAQAFRSVCDLHHHVKPTEDFPQSAEPEVLRRHIAGLQQKARALATETRRRRESEDALRAYQDRLELMVAERTQRLQDSNRELEAFNYAVSHDLKTPLRAIGSYSQLVRRRLGNDIPPDVGRMLDQVDQGAVRMNELIEDLLDLSRLHAVTPSAEPVDLSALASEAAQMLRESDPEHAVALDVQPGIVARADPKLMRVVFANLMSNAWKFTRRTLHPKVRVEWAEPGLVRVADNGAGFDPEQASRLFQPFQRLHRTTEFEGSGIGLATVARIIHRHGGTIWATGRPNGGATFTFTLPGLGTPPATPAAVAG